MRIIQSTSFKKDVKRQLKREKDPNKLKALVDLLIADEGLTPQYPDHPLAGNWLGWRDCHIEPDWILIYKVAKDELLLGRTGTHSDLF